ncbi:hypothetical protein C3731_15820 [Brucella oryzae]|uniref:Uncharacterized protein n=1 Tax=Brucella oryzae TaxID=335286 RepID=A0A2S7IX78_9HYPH|nr:hypothetical protein C3731_15820 [Brucella oryzae]
MVFPWYGYQEHIKGRPLCCLHLERSGPNGATGTDRIFVSSHYPAHRNGNRNQSSGLISPRRRFALLLEMF